MLRTNSTSIGRLSLGAAILFVAMAQAGIANAATYTLNTVFNGSTPTSTPPWLTANFSQDGANTVKLTLTSSLNVSSEFMTEIGFNVNSTITPSSLGILQNPGSPVASAILAGAQNAENLTGGGAAGFGFDVLIDFTSANNVNRFD